jgi:opacity protein-like surface antigen
MKRIVAVVLAVALVGYLGCGANAAEIVKAGSERIAIMGAAHYADFAGDADAYASIFMVATEYGYMVTDQFELAARAMVALAQAGAAGSTVRMQLYSLAAVPKWRIPMEGNISPYIGPMVGVAYATGSGAGALHITGVHTGGSFHDAVFAWGAVAGADIFLSKQTALFVEYDFTTFKLGGSKFGGGPERVRDQGLSAGLVFWW